MRSYFATYWAFWAFILLMVIAVGVRLANRRLRKSIHEEPPSSAFPSTQVELLKEQLVRGEISPEEFERRKRELQRDLGAA